MLVVAPTVMALGVDAGEKLHALRLSFPAATTIVTPANTAFATAVFTLVDWPPPSDMLATAGRSELPATQSTQQSRLPKFPTQRS